MSDKHTPGPWTAMHSLEIYKVYDDSGIDRPEHAVSIAYVELNSLPDEETIANARLIAAAPELLEACKAMIELNEITGDLYPEITERARKVIEKATESKP